jgi:nucleoside-diphosphate-sugar epimerase
MKLIIFGSTGFIGKEILLQCLQNPKISSVVSISRSDPEIQHEKLEVILHSDYTSFPLSLRSKLEHADGCLYCIGPNGPIKPPERDREVHFTYATTTSSVMAELYQSMPETTKPFKFVYLSGALPEKDQNKKLWLVEVHRKMRGELENALLKLDGERRGTGFEIYIARPGFVVPPGAVLRQGFFKLAGFKSITINQVAAAMIDLAFTGNDSSIVENEELIERSARTS